MRENKDIANFELEKHFPFSIINYPLAVRLYPEDEKGEKVQLMLDLFDILTFKEISDAGFRENREYDDWWNGWFFDNYEVEYIILNTRTGEGDGNTSNGIFILGTNEEKNAIKSALESITDSYIELDGEGRISKVIYNLSTSSELQGNLIGLLNSGKRIDIMFMDHDAITSGDGIGTGFYQPGQKSFGYLENHTVILDRQHYLLNNGIPEYYYLKEVGFLGHKVFGAGRQSLETALAHEFLGHGSWHFTLQEPKIWENESYAVYIENIVHGNMGEPYRYFYHDYYIGLTKSDLKLPEFMLKPWKRGK